MADVFSSRITLALDPRGDGDDETLAMMASFREFCRQALPLFVPSVIKWNYHIDAMCDHLQAVTEGEIQNLIISVPPRCLKSSIASVCWTAWEWITQPRLRYMFASYNMDLSRRDNDFCRELIKTEWYQRRWGYLFRIKKSTDSKTLFENTLNGRRLATSVTAGNTGEGGERIVVDDPHSVLKAESDTTRVAVLNWWSRIMSTRVNSATSAKVIIAQRTHHQDLIGYVMDQERNGGETYEKLILPMEYDPKLIVRVEDLKAFQFKSDDEDEEEVEDEDFLPPEFPEVGLPESDRPNAFIPEVNGLGFKDPRDTPGELLHPDQWPAKSMRLMKFVLGPFAWSAQYQQSPSPSEGGQFKEHYWQRYSFMPLWHAGLRAEIIVVDSSYGSEDGDYTGVSVWGQRGGRLYIMDARLWREENPVLRRKLRDLHKRWKVPFLIEDKANGRSLIQDLRRGGEDGGLPALPVIPFTPDGMSKEARAYSVVSYVAGGLVYIPDDADWADEWIKMHSQFPKGQHDDWVDNTSMAIIWLAKHTAEVRTLLEHSYKSTYGAQMRTNHQLPMPAGWSP